MCAPSLSIVVRVGVLDSVRVSFLLFDGISGFFMHSMSITF